MSVFEKTITITFADFVAFNKVHTKRFRIRPLWVWLAITLLSVFIFCIGYTTQPAVTERGILFTIFFFVFVYGMFVAGIWLLILLFKLLYRLILFITYKLNSDSFVNVNVLINEKGIDYTTRRNHYVALWPQILRVYDDGQRYFIYYAKNAVFILPKRYIGSLDQRQEFAYFLKAYSNPDLKYTAPKEI